MYVCMYVRMYMSICILSLFLFIYIYIPVYRELCCFCFAVLSTCFLFSWAQGGFWSSNHHIAVSVRLQEKEKERKKKKSFPKVPSTSHPSRQRAWERWSLGQLITTGIKLKFVTKKKERKDYSTFFLFLLFIDKRTVFLLLRMIYFNHSTCKRNAPLMG